MWTPCEVADCGRPVVTGGLCDMHRKRFARHGTLENTRPKGWGNGRTHPLYERWRSMRRAAERQGGCVSRWDDFWLFVHDVGFPPDLSWRLWRRDEKAAWGPDNFVWRARVVSASMDSTSQESRNAYMRAYHAERPHILKAKYLKRYYGITMADYEHMFAEQRGVCAICQQPETAMDHRGRVRWLAVDHDRGTGAIRALLCTKHNTALGLFGDDPALLRAAIAYLDQHGGAAA